MNKNYMSEIQGMVDFYDELGIIPSYDLNTDGVIYGTLIEFKKHQSVEGGIINHKKQIKRYLDSFNSVARDIPSKSLLIYLNSSEYIKIDNEGGVLLNKDFGEEQINSKIS